MDNIVITGIYGLQNKLKPDKWYIGNALDIEFRWHKAYELLNCQQQPKIYHALRKYGYDGFNKVVLEECPKEKLLEREIYWTRFYDAVKKGYNLKEGGFAGERPGDVRSKISASHKGKKHSPETIAKMKAAKLGKKHSIEHNVHIAQSNTGKKRSKEFCEKMSRIRIGMTFSAEHCAHIADVKRGHTVSEETKAKMRASQQKRRLTPVSEETKRRLSEAAKRRVYA